MRYLLLLFLLHGLISSVAGQASNPLDVTFADNGELNLSFGSSHEIMSGVALLSDGRIIVAGAVHVSTTEGVRVARLLADGTLDTSFGIGGIMELPDSQFQSNHPVSAFTAPDGDVMVVSGGWGFATKSELAVIWKFDSDGNPDQSFGTEGRVIIPEFSLYVWYMRPFMDADGTLYITGMHYDHPLGAPGLLVIDPSGAVDFDFALEARLLLKGTFDGFDWRIRRLTDGNWILFGYGNTFGYPLEYRMVRVFEDGSVDESFGIDGLVEVQGGITDVMDLDDGSLLLIQKEGEVDLARLTPEGHPDITFGNAGVMDLPGEQGYRMFHRDINGAISAWGAVSDQNIGFYYYISQLDDSGYPISDQIDTPDAVIDRFLYVPWFGQLVNQPDGKIVLSGRSSVYGVGVKTYVARIDPALVVGVESADMESRSFLMSPNPCRAGDQLTMELSPDMVHDLRNVTLCSLSTGQKHDVSVIPFHAEAGVAFELPQVAAGVYVISVHTDSQSLQSRLVVME
jgi:uncharacterized delta-60 repeat protein